MNFYILYFLFIFDFIFINLFDLFCFVCSTTITNQAAHDHLTWLLLTKIPIPHMAGSLFSTTTITPLPSLRWQPPPSSLAVSSSPSLFKGCSSKLYSSPSHSQQLTNTSITSSQFKNLQSVQPAKKSL